MDAKLTRLADLEADDQLMIREAVEDFFDWLDRKRQRLQRKLKRQCKQKGGDAGQIDP